ncbi:MAG: T9SS type A sorting domain-containing protein [Bacteroidetes bacterium]|nr:T9SS type A sorting domain-containing protein [Bacteroidota bacterium]
MKVKIYLSLVFFVSFSINTFGLCIPPAITSQPANTVVCLGGNTSFSVSATGASLNFQWQVNQGAGFVNLTNVIPYSGVTTSTLSITGVTFVLSDYLYRCIVSNGCAPNDTSAAALLKVNTPPSISIQPANDSVCDGSNGTFGVTTAGSGLTYQWQVNTGSGFVNVVGSTIYSGDTTATLSITGASASMNNYSFQCIINGTCAPSVTTSSALLIINALPAITLQPNIIDVCQGNTTSISITTTGTSLTYQWQVNSGSGFVDLTNTAPYSGVTTSSLTITAATMALNGSIYHCIISGVCSPAVISNSYPFSVHPIYSNYIPVTICQGDSTLFAGTYYSTPGLYPHLFSTVSGCDSLEYLSLSVSSAYYTTTTSVICNGDSVLLGTSFQSTAGVYTYVLPTISGCDSTIENTLSVKPSYHFNQSTTICQGDSALIFGNYESIDSLYTDNYTTFLGCDSIYTHQLNVVPPFAITLNANVCSGDSVIIAGTYESLSGTYINNYVSSFGCDSVVTTILMVQPNYSISRSISICSYDSVLLSGSFQTIAGIYIDSLFSTYGCDSIVTTSLSVNAAPIVVFDQTVSICDTASAFILTGGTPLGGTYSGIGVSAGIFSPSVAGLGTHTITYSYTDLAGCSDSDTSTITVTVCLGVNELNSDSYFSVYPNPFQDHIVIISNTNENLELQITNVLGESVLFQKINKGKTEINLADLSTGIYFIQSTTAGITRVQKLIKN